MTDRQSKSTRAGGRGKWYIVDVVVREKILVEIPDDGGDEYDAKEIALGESILFQTEKDKLEVEVCIEPAPNALERLEREMRYADRVIPMWGGDQGAGGEQ